MQEGQTQKSPHVRAKSSQLGDQQLDCVIVDQFRKRSRKGRYKKPGAGPGFRIYMKSYCAAGKSMVAALKLKTYVLFDNCAFYFASKFVDHTAIYIVIRIFRFKS